MGLGKQKTEVQKGDSLSKIAKNAGISVSKIKELNPQIKNPNLIKPGQKINTSSGFMGNVMSGIKSAGSQIKSDFKHSTGQEKYTGAALEDYKKRSAASKKAMDDFLKQTSKDDSPSGIAALKNTGTAGAATGDMADQYAENLRRYNEYMQGQNALTVMPQQREVTPEMRQAALQTFESQRGAGQMPYYMAAAANSQAPDMSPAFQYAAQNYATLGGSQRLGPRPMEMMSVAERRQINDMAQAMADQQAQQMDYQRGMDMIMRGGGKGGGATMPQTGGGMPRPPLPFAYGQPSPFASMLSQRFGGFGRY